MKHLGDIRKIKGADIRPVDVITFGSPCQDLSIAGKRAGLSGERSGLFMEAVRVIKEMRKATNGRYPTFAVWENVLGAFSSNKGKDFRKVLESLCSICQNPVSVPEPEKRWLTAGEIVGDGFSIAWRVMDAQYWGVPQRRRRIALVADFRGERAGEILFKPQSMSGDSETCGEARKASAGKTAEGVSHAEGSLQTDGRRITYSAGFKGHSGATAGGTGYQEGRSPTLTAGQQIHIIYSTFDCRGNGGGDIIPTMTGDHQNRVTDYTSILCMSTGQSNAEICENKSPTLHCGHEQPLIAGDFVRRFTPLECERLQGYPDGWTDIPGASDTARYKALGNSIALPQWRYVLGNISRYLSPNAKLGSLFDGIGGFPLIWEEIHGRKSAVWASEIEKFPIAVTTYHFGESR